MTILNLHPILLNSPAAVRERFKLLPETRMAVEIPLTTLRGLEIAVEFLEQLTEGEIFKEVREQTRSTTEEILLNLPTIKE